MKLFTDGGARGNPGPSAIGCFLFNDDNSLVDFFGTYIGETTNNQAEYTALINGLELAQGNNAEELECFLDSELVVKQINGLYKVSHVDMKPLYEKVFILKKDFKKISFTHVRREQNSFADKMVNLILDNKTV